MFFDPQRIHNMREMILATDEEGRRRPRQAPPLPAKDFIGIFQAMKGLPVTIRLLDPPLHEFLPHEEKEQYELANSQASASSRSPASEPAPRGQPDARPAGDRLAITYPEILEMQVTAIIEAAIECKVKVLPEIMIPLAGTKEARLLQENHPEETADRIMKEGHQGRLPVRHDDRGAPRAVTADEMAQTAEFFSFGTNDLTQMTFGYSRDDVNSFLPDYLRRKSWSATRSSRSTPAASASSSAWPSSSAAPSPRPQVRRLRRTRRRPQVRRILPSGRPGLRELLAVPSPHRPARRGAGRDQAAAERRIKVRQAQPAGRRRSGSNRARPR